MIELDTPCSVGANIAFVGLPTHAKDDDPIRLGHSFQNLCFAIVFMIEVPGQHGRSHFLNRLVKLTLVWVAMLQTLHERSEFVINPRHEPMSCCV